MITIRVTQPFPAIIDLENLPCPYLFRTQPPKNLHVYTQLLPWQPFAPRDLAKEKWKPQEVEKGGSWLGIHLRCVARRKDGMLISLRKQKYRRLACFYLLVAFVRGNPGCWPFCPLGKIAAYSRHQTGLLTPTVFKCRSKYETIVICINRSNRFNFQ